jgi:O-antigen/teichoic acid export membrane protein
MQKHRQLMADSLWAVSGQGLMTVQGFAINLLLARLLPPQEMGRYFLLVSLVAVGVVLSQFGLDQIAVRRVAVHLSLGDTARVSGVVRDILWLGTSGAIFASLGMAGVSSAFGWEPGMVLVVIAWIGTLTWQNLLAEILRGFHDIRGATLYGRVISGTVSVSLLAFLWAFHSPVGLGQVTPVLVLGSCVSILLAGLAVRRRIPRGVAAGPPAKSHLSSLVREAWPVLLNTLVWVVRGQADLWVLSVFRPPAEVAVYGIVTRLATFLTVPQALTRSVISARIADLYTQEKRADLEQFLRRSATLAGGLAVAAYAAIALGGGSLLGLLYGWDYGAGAPAFLLLGLGQVIAVGAGLSATTMIMAGHQHKVLAVSLVSGLFTLLAAVPLARWYGMAGVAGAVGAGTALQNIVMLFAAKRAVGVWTHFRVGPEEAGL